MKKTLIALTAAAGFGLAGLAAAPVVAAPIAPVQLGLAVDKAGVQIEQVRHRRHSRRHHHHHRHAHRHYWPRRWAYGHCFRLGGVYVCQY